MDAEIWPLSGRFLLNQLRKYDWKNGGYKIGEEEFEAFRLTGHWNEEKTKRRRKMNGRRKFEGGEGEGLKSGEEMECGEGQEQQQQEDR